ncbi:hypothetical protein VKT23_011963 [Stygiomarasmius scandens]|uniref:NmrA-like domain-containing protein n=1 Tax=Marasmiellus scandens TaxID=2682957 RepID=A0ABR1JC20_9AGAR
MSTGTKILVTGATGYIGGSILTRLLQRSDFSEFDIRVLVRSSEKGKKLEGLGFKSVIGSHTDESIMVKAVSEVDVVIATADCDDLVAAQLTLKGMKKRFEETGKQPIFIHTASIDPTSGTGVYLDLAGGMRSTDVIYDDANPDQIETLAPTQPHRIVDLEIIAADKEGYIKSYIVLPPTVYGIATGSLFEAGISNPHSIQVPFFIKAAIARRQGGMIGEGKNVWPNVNIHESLVSLGLGDNSLPSTFSAEEEKKYFGPFALLFGTNSRCLATRAKSLGWKPVKTTKDLLASIKPEIEILLASGKTALPDLSVFIERYSSAIPVSS